MFGEISRNKSTVNPASGNVFAETQNDLSLLDKMDVNTHHVAAEPIQYLNIQWDDSQYEWTS